MSNTVRTRFAPSPTGFLHLGGARTALFSWAFARHFKGTFVLRVEDTDVERSTPEAVQAILDGMQWLNLAHDEGPFFQMQHMDRYRAVIQEMLAAGTAYYCYSSPEEVDAMREKAMALGLKPRYDGTWRPEPGKVLPAIPADRKPVVRFRNPQEGVVTWEDMVKGTISIANAELDDLIIARPDGTPTYNFCVVVDDWDMRITHVIRGDDHVNNTPRQINILRALGATLPIYGHVPMILGPDGQKLSKRHGAVSVMQYDTLGYLPEAMLNYLGRLGWSHQDTELFTMDEMVQWFDGTHLSRSAAQWDPKKLNWVNAHYMKTIALERLQAAVQPRLVARGVHLADDRLQALLGLYRERAETLEQLADALVIFADMPVVPDAEAYATHITPAVQPAIAAFAAKVATCEWTAPAIQSALKEVLAEFGLKMPQLAIPVRVLVAGVPQTPSIEQVLFLMGREIVMKRLQKK